MSGPPPEHPRPATLAAGPDVPPGVVIRPERPTRIDFATAVLVVSGAFSIFRRVLDPLVLPDPTSVDPILAVSIVLDALSIAAGILVRMGRAWVLAANLAAIFSFLHLSASPNPVAIFFGSLYVGVVLVVMSARGWFDAMSAWRRAVSEAHFRR
jgi:hypothetical protein